MYEHYSNRGQQNELKRSVSAAAGKDGKSNHQLIKILNLQLNNAIYREVMIE